MQTHKNLTVWKRSIELGVLTYKITRGFPKEEIFGITSQMRRAVLSISFNIAEGHGRNSDKDLVRFLYISLGSASEFETQIIVAHKLEFLTNEEFNMFNSEISEIIKMLVALIRSKKVD